MKKRTKIRVINFVIALLVFGAGYVYFDVGYVPLELYEMQNMEPGQKEAYYVEKWCSASFGRREYVLLDKTRVDCYTKDYAIEFDFAHKWAESIGQSLYYSKMTNKKPAVAIILNSPDDLKYVKRIEKTKQDIKIFLIKAY